MESSAASAVSSSGRQGLADAHDGEHAELENTLVDLHRRAYSGHAGDLGEVWSAFCAMLEAHMRFEEETVFPEYLEDHPEARAAIDAFCEEHAKLRSIVESLAIDIQLNTVRAEGVDRFIELNRAHAAEESRRFESWLKWIPAWGVAGRGGVL